MGEEKGFFLYYAVMARTRRHAPAAQYYMVLVLYMLYFVVNPQGEVQRTGATDRLRLVIYLPWQQEFD